MNGPDAIHVAGRILPGRENADLFVKDGRFTFQPQAGATTLIEGAYLVPGLTDMHAHLSIASPSPSEDPAERVRASLEAHLQAGVLAVREPGSPDRESAGRGPHEGLPRTYTAGRFLAPPGAYFPGLARPAPGEMLAELGEEEWRASGDWVKVIGDDPTTPDFERTYTRDQLAAVARRVHELGGRIAIHTCREDVISDAIEARFDSIEHGIGMREDQLAAMASSNLAFVPTMSILEGVAMIAEGSGTVAGREVAAATQRHADAVRSAHAAGVLVLAGTDAGMGPHGLVREEIALLQRAGLPAEAALGAGSWAGRRFLGLPGIEEGAPADLVAFRDDPADPDVLARPALVILDGRVVTPRE